LYVPITLQLPIHPNPPEPVSNIDYLLQLEKEQNPDAASKKHVPHNCCVTFTDASPDLESALTQGNGHNCCVSFRSTKIDAKREQRIPWFVAFAFVVAMFLFFGAISLSGLSSNSKAKMDTETALKLD
jgi:hypothetical protein